MTPPRILFINPHASGNVGDAALLDASVRGVRRICPDAGLAVATRYRSDAGTILGLGAEPVAPLIDFPAPGEASNVARAGRLAVSLLRNRTLARPGPRGAPLEAADAVLSCAGGYIFSRRRPQLSLAHVLAEIECAARLRPTILLPQSIGPFYRERDRARVRRALRDVRRVLVRDSSSVRVAVEELGLDAGLVEQAPDLAFGLAERSPARAAADQRRVAVTVLDWRWAGGTDLQFARYLDAVVATAQGLLDRGCQVELVVQVDLPSHPGHGDRSCTQRVATRLSGEVPVIWAGSTSAQALERYAGYDLVLASRLHSALLALCAGVPAIALGYQPKSAGVFTDVGLEDWVADVRSLDAAALLEQADAILADAEAPNRAASAAIGARDRLESALAEALSPWVRDSEGTRVASDSRSRSR